MASVEQTPPFKLSETYREQPALYCTECNHPVTAFIDGSQLYVGCLKKNKKVSGDHWHLWDSTEDMFDSWEEVSFGFWPGVTEWFVETIKTYMA